MNVKSSARALAGLLAEPEMNTGGNPMLDVYCSTKKTKIVRLNGKIIGRLEDGILSKHVRGSCHMLIRPRSWALDAEAFDKEVKPNATKIIIRDKETGLKYHCSVENFDRLKGELDRGFGRQYFLTLNHWEMRGNGYHQLSFWEGGDSHA